MGAGGKRHATAASLLGRNPVPFVHGAGWAPGPVWRRAEILASTVIRSPDRPARGELLYRLCYPGRESFDRRPTQISNKLSLSAPDILTDACDFSQSVKMIDYVRHECMFSDLNILSTHKNIPNSFMSNDLYIWHNVVKYPSNHSDSY
jgi:hypothetical protein